MYDYMLPAAVFGALSGALAGTLILRSFWACVAAWFAVFILNIALFDLYAYFAHRSDIHPLTAVQIFASNVLYFPLHFIAAGMPAMGACLVSAVLCRISTECRNSQ